MLGDGERQETLRRIRFAIRCLEVMASRVEHPDNEGEALFDDLETISRVHGALASPPHQRQMRLIEAIAICATEALLRPITEEVGPAYGFDGAAFRRAVDAWNEPEKVRFGAVQEALRTVKDLEPASPDSIRRYFDAWEKARGGRQNHSG